MRILIVSTSYPIDRNGSEAAGSFVEDFAKELASSGAVVAVSFPVSNVVSDFAEDEITLFPFRVPRVPLSALSVSSPSDWMKIARTLSAGGRSVVKAAEKFKPDFVFSLWALPSGYWALRHCRNAGIPYGTWALGSDIWALGKIPVIKNVLRHVLKKSNINFADGIVLARDVEAISGGECHFLPSTRKLLRVGDNNVGIRSKSPYRLTFIGRWHQNKGIDILLDALLMLGSDSWSLIESVNIAGGGPLADVVKQKTTKLIGQGRPVELSGYVNKDQACALLDSTDFLLIPSRVESIPVVFSDAMQSGCPVISTPVGDIPELVSRFKCGLVAESISVDAYAKVISHALKTKTRDYEKGVGIASKTFSLPQIIEKFNLMIRD